ncbi:hypothetical protein NX059_006501 [Plenodomus lindquistii]|nr:hypothetical protein NX059_006501 [Plenodomus lindquistii]
MAAHFYHLSGDAGLETEGDNPRGDTHYSEINLTKLQDLLTEPKRVFFEKACQKGAMLTKLMQANDHQAGQMLTPARSSATSSHLDVNDLAHGGYHPMKHSPYMTQPIAAVLKNMYMFAKDITPVCHKHDKSDSHFRQLVVPSQAHSPISKYQISDVGQTLPISSGS